MLHSLLALALVAAPSAAARTPKVLFLGIDGFRPSVLTTTNTPNLDALMRDGCYVLDALTDEHTISGAGWSNLLTGVWAYKHGVTNNEFKEPRYDRYPHLFQRLTAHDPPVNCGQYTSWEPLETKILGETKIAGRFFHDYKDHGDEHLMKAAVKDLESLDLDFVFVYFADLDETGHSYGFHETVPQYRTALETIDAQIGELRSAIARRSDIANEDWLILVTSDHGGSLDRSHGRDIEEHRIIPFVVSGRAAQRGPLFESVNQVDLMATALAHLGIAPPPEWGLEGRPVGLRLAAPVELLDRNLIANGNAEANGGNDTAETPCWITGFHDRGAMTSVRYDAPGGFPSASTPGSVTRGKNFFAGGAATSSTIEQRIDLTPLGDAIDVGAIAYDASAWLGGFAHQRDLAWLEIRFEGQAGDRLQEIILPPVTLEDRVAAFGLPAPPSDPKAEVDPARFSHLTGFLERRARGAIPQRTRHVVIRLRAEAAAGTGDGYADDLSFVVRRREARGDAAAVADTLRRILAADNAGDLDAIVGCYTADAVLLPPNSPPLEGRELIRERYRAILAAATLELRAEADEIRVDGDTAWIRGVTLGQTKAKDGSATMPVADNFFMLMRREADEWRIARLMWHPRS